MGLEPTTDSRPHFLSREAPRPAGHFPSAPPRASQSGFRHTIPAAINRDAQAPTRNRTGIYGLGNRCTIHRAVEANPERAKHSGGVWIMDHVGFEPTSPMFWLHHFFSSVGEQGSFPPAGSSVLWHITWRLHHLVYVQERSRGATSLLLFRGAGYPALRLG